VSTVSLLNSLKSPENLVLIFSSSCSVYGLYSNGNIRETGPVEPDSIYSKSKLEAEAAIIDFSLKNRMRTAIARIFNVYGNGETKSIVSKIFHSVQKGDKMSFDPDLIRDFIHVEDVCSGLITLSESGKGIYNLGTGAAIQLLELKKVIEQKLGSELLIVPYRGSVVPISVANIEKISKLGWYPKLDIIGGLNYITEPFLDK